MRESTRKKLTLYLSAMLFLHVFLAWHSWRGIRIGLPDFSIFYTAGEILHEGRGFELYDDKVQETVQRSFSPIGLEKRGSILPYNHPPFEALVFVPLVRLPYLPAYLVWFAINLGLTLALLVLLRRNFVILGSAPVYLWILAALGFFPLFVALIQGQDSIFVLFCYTMAFLAFRQGVESRAGGWCALALCKFHLVLPFVFPFVPLRRKKFLASFFLVAIVLVLIGLAAVGWKGWLSYPVYVLSGENNQSYLWNASLGNTANLRGLIATLCPREPRLRIGLILVVSAILLAGTTYAWRKALQTAAVYLDLVFALGLVATVLLSYHIYVHDLSILFLAIVIVFEVLLSSQAFHGRIRSVLYGCMGVLSCSPIYLLLTLRYKQLELMAAILLVFAVVLFVEFVRIQPGVDARPPLRGSEG
jgi:Glycosyltransferase family 87